MDKKEIITVIDDSPTVLSQISLLLRDTYRLKLFRSGKDFLRYTKGANFELPDLILLDVHMPDMDGYEVLKEIKQSETLREIPVIFLTAKAGEDYEREGLELGAVDYVTKPFSPSILFTRIKNHLYIKKAKDTLREKNQELEKLKNLYFELFNNAPVGYLTIDEEGKVIEYNQTLSKMVDLRKEKGRVCNINELVDLGDKESVEKLLSNLKQPGDEGLIEVRLKKDSDRVFGLLTAKRLHDHFLVTITDITELKEIQRRCTTYIDIIDRAPISILISNSENRIIYVNKFYCELTGYCREELLGKDPGFIKSGKTPKETYESLWRSLNNKKPWNGNFINRKKSGELFTEEAWIQPVLDEEGNITNYVAIKVDITEKLNLLEKERSLIRAKSLITLSGGIAHHLNNINTPLLLISDFLSKRLAGQREFEKMLDIVIKSVNKATELVNSIRIFSKNVIMMPKNVCIADIVEKALRECKDKGLLRPEIAVINRLNYCDRYTIRGDEDMLKLALVNIIENSIEAMPEGGSIIIDGGKQEIEREGLKGKFFSISVTDTGLGIPDDIRDRVFEPFFTTKLEKNAKGLGLSEVLGIVEQHGGFVEIESEVGKGTTVKIYLPLD